MTEEKLNIKNIILFALLLSGAVSFIISMTTLVAGAFLGDPLSIVAEGHKFAPTRPLIKLFCFILVIIGVFLYIPLKLGILKQTISRKGGIVLVTLLTYLLSSVSLAVFLSFTTELIDYNELSTENFYTKELRDNGVPCNFDLKESFFDSVSGFTTTGLTAFRRTYVYDIYGREISKIDAQPRLIHIIRAVYLWMGGLGIMFFYLYFTPVPSLMMSMGYEMPAERSLPRFIRLESLSFSLVYVVITIVGILFLFLAISSAYGSEGVDDKTKLTYSVVLSLSSISTGGFSPGSQSVDELAIERQCITRYPLEIKNYSPEKEKYIFGKCCMIEELFNKNYIIKGDSCSISFFRCHIINDLGLLIIMVLMLAGAMPIFSLHRPLKYFRRWKIFVLFLLPILVYAILPYAGDAPEVSLYRSFDTISAFTTTGLYTSQFVEDSNIPLETEYKSEYKKTEYKSEYRISEYKKTEYKSEYRISEYNIGDEKERIKEIYKYRLQNIYIIILMFIGGATYSTAGGWGFFNFFCIIYAFFFVLNGKIERVLTKFVLRLILSFLIFFLFFAIGTLGCYMSGLFGTFSGPEPAKTVDYVISSAFYEISALSTVGLMPDSMLQNDGIYYHNLAYITLAASMLIGRLYYIIFPFIVSLITPEGGI